MISLDKFMATDGKTAQLKIKELSNNKHNDGPIIV